MLLRVVKTVITCKHDHGVRLTVRDHGFRAFLKAVQLTNVDERQVDDVAFIMSDRLWLCLNDLALAVNAVVEREWLVEVILLERTVDLDCDVVLF